MKRSELLELLTANILGIKHERPLLVAIDGYDAAGKSILAKELAEKLRGLGLNIIEASIDGFHNPRVIRYKRGEESPEGYYYDSFNYAALKVIGERKHHDAHDTFCIRIRTAFTYLDVRRELLSGLDDHRRWPGMNSQSINNLNFAFDHEYQFFFFPNPNLIRSFRASS